jgi:hypothetical protein
MKRILIFALFLLFSKTIFSQEKETDSLLTEKQNAEWIAEFEKLDSKFEQLSQIKKKIESDSIYYVGNVHFHTGLATKSWTFS